MYRVYDPTFEKITKKLFTAHDFNQLCNLCDTDTNADNYEFLLAKSNGWYYAISQYSGKILRWKQEGTSYIGESSAMLNDELLERFWKEIKQDRLGKS